MGRKSGDRIGPRDGIAIAPKCASADWCSANDAAQAELKIYEEEFDNEPGRREHLLQPLRSRVSRRSVSALQAVARDSAADPRSVRAGCDGHSLRRCDDRAARPC